MKPVLFPSSTWDDVRNEVETCLRYLFRRELQEWGADRFYVAISQDGIPSLADSAGFMSRCFSQTYRAELDARFTTHAPGMFIDTSRLGECTEGSFQRFCEMVIHETAHIVQEQYPQGHFSAIVDRPPSKPKRAKRGKIDPHTTIEPTEDQKKHGRRLTYWANNIHYHQADFVRSLVHVASRAFRHGWQEQEHQATFGYYTPGSMWGFQFALESELHDYADRSLTGIWSHDPPAMFTGGWERLHRAPQTWMNRITAVLIELDKEERSEREQHAANQKPNRARRKMVQGIT